MKLTDLKGAPYNPRKISTEAFVGLSKSLGRFGDISGIVFNTRTGRLVAGHQRVTALRELHGDLKVERERILLPTGESFRVRMVDWDEATERLANVAANNPLLGGEFTDDIADVLDGLEAPDLEDVRLDELLATLSPPEITEATQDTAPTEASDRRCRPGDLWILGDHRLLCGDATNAEDVERLLGGEVPALMVTDPPYGVHYDPEWRTHAAGPKFGGERLGEVTADDRADWSSAIALFPGDVSYIWCASLGVHIVAQSIEAAGFDRRNLLIWVKPRIVFGRGHYHWQHEQCWYSVRRGRSGRWIGDRKQSTIWEIKNHNPMGGEQDDADTAHSTQKPVECMARPIRNHEAAIVYDPFVGSGTTIIAAEQIERRCFAIEIDPNYCDIAIERWENFSQSKAERVP